MSAADEEQGHLATEVSPLELFFDLVFVFAVSQLSEHLLAHLSWRGAAETFVLLIAVFAVWSYTSFGASLPGLGRRSTVAAVFIVLTLALFMNAGISGAFEQAPAALTVPFLICRLGLVVIAAVIVRGDAIGRHYSATLVWVAVEAALWVVGTLVEPEPRLGWWAAGAVLGVVGSWTAHPVPGRRFRTSEVPFVPDRMVERSRLFLLIALGEAVLTTGTAIAAAGDDVRSIAAGVLALIAISALWLVYFGGSDRLVSGVAATAADSLRVARLAINTQVVVLLGLIVLAVGIEITIDGDEQVSRTVLALLLFGGPVLYLGAQTWYLRALTGRTSTSRLVGIIALLVAGVLAQVLAPVGSLGLLAVLLLATSIATLPGASAALRRVRPHD